MGDNKSFLRRAYEFFQRKWWIPFLISIVPGGIPTLLGVTKDFQWFNFFYSEASNGEKYIKEGYAIFFLVAWVLCSAFSFCWYAISRNENKVDTNRMLVYKKAIDMIKRHNKDYYDRTLNLSKEKKYKSKKGIGVYNALKAINNQSSRWNAAFNLGHTLTHISRLLEYAFGINQNELSITVIHKPVNSDIWEVLQQINSSEFEDDLQKIINDPKSSYSAVLKEKRGQVFYSDKNEAVAKKEYVPNSFELRNGMNGSIFCENLSIYKNGKIDRGFALAVSTKTVKFAEPNEPYSENFCKEMLGFAIDLIKPELIRIHLNESVFGGIN